MAITNRILPRASVTFDPAARTLDFSAVAGFDPRRVLAVINDTTGTTLYAKGELDLVFSANGPILTLAADTSAMSSSDLLVVFYEPDGAALPGGAATADLQTVGNTSLTGILAALAGTLRVDGSAVTQPVSAAALPLPSGASTEATLQQVLTAIRAQRVETIWTDDTGTRFIRVDIGGTIVWTDVAGNASSAPGSGARPDSDSGVAVSRQTFRATAAGTGFASGDVLDHLVVTDGDAGDLIANFWLNINAGTRIAAPPAGSITPLAPLPDGAATAAGQASAGASLTALTVGIGAPADVAASSDAGAFSLIALAKRALGNWTTLLARVPALVSGRMPVDGSGVTQPVSAAALPLPTGAATAANQASEIAALGAPADTAYAGTGSPSIIAALKGIYTALVAPTPAGTNAIGSVTVSNGSVLFNETSTPLPANGVFIGPTRDAGATGPYSYFNVNVIADQAGTVSIDVSDDGTNYTNLRNDPVTAGTQVTVAQKITWRYHRVRYGNGATAQGGLRIHSSYTSA